MFMNCLGDWKDVTTRTVMKQILIAMGTFQKQFSQTIILNLFNNYISKIYDYFNNYIFNLYVIFLSNCPNKIQIPVVLVMVKPQAAPDQMGYLQQWCPHLELEFQETLPCLQMIPWLQEGLMRESAAVPDLKGKKMLAMVLLKLLWWTSPKDL